MSAPQLAFELADDDTHVNTIAPDQTRTPGNSGHRNGPLERGRHSPRPAEHRDAMTGLVILGCEGAIADCAPVRGVPGPPRVRYVNGPSSRYPDGDWTPFGGIGWA